MKKKRVPLKIEWRFASKDPSTRLKKLFDAVILKAQSWAQWWMHNGGLNKTPSSRRFFIEEARLPQYCVSGSTEKGYDGKHRNYHMNRCVNPASSCFHVKGYMRKR